MNSDTFIWYLVYDYKMQNKEFYEIKESSGYSYYNNEFQKYAIYKFKLNFFRDKYTVLDKSHVAIEENENYKLLCKLYKVPFSTFVKILNSCNRNKVEITSDDIMINNNRWCDPPKLNDCVYNRIIRIAKTNDGLDIYTFTVRPDHFKRYIHVKPNALDVDALRKGLEECWCLTSEQANEYTNSGGYKPFNDISQFNAKASDYLKNGNKYFVSCRIQSRGITGRDYIAYVSDKALNEKLDEAKSEWICVTVINKDTGEKLRSVACKRRKSGSENNKVDIIRGKQGSIYHDKYINDLNSWLDNDSNFSKHIIMIDESLKDALSIDKNQLIDYNKDRLIIDEPFENKIIVEVSAINYKEIVNKKIDVSRVFKYIFSRKDLYTIGVRYSYCNVIDAHRTYMENNACGLSRELLEFIGCNSGDTVHIEHVYYSESQNQYVILSVLKTAFAVDLGENSNKANDIDTRISLDMDTIKMLRLPYNQVKFKEAYVRVSRHNMSLILKNDGQLVLSIGALGVIALLQASIAIFTSSFVTDNIVQISDWSSKSVIMLLVIYCIVHIKSYNTFLSESKKKHRSSKNGRLILAVLSVMIIIQVITQSMVFQNINESIDFKVSYILLGITSYTIILSSILFYFLKKIIIGKVKII